MPWVEPVDQSEEDLGPVFNNNNAAVYKTLPSSKKICAVSYKNTWYLSLVATGYSCGFSPGLYRSVCTYKMIQSEAYHQVARTNRKVVILRPWIKGLIYFQSLLG